MKSPPLRNSRCKGKKAMIKSINWRLTVGRLKHSNSFKRRHLKSLRFPTGSGQTDSIPVTLESKFDRCRLNLILWLLDAIVRVFKLNIPRTLLLGPGAHRRNLGKIGAIGVFFGDFADFHHQPFVQRNGNKTLG